MKIRRAYRIVTFLPCGSDYITAADFLDQINERFVLGYGNYDKVAYYSEGTEQYRPLENANPTHGDVNQTSVLKSTRVEFSLPHDDAILKSCLELIQSIHPWEEPVIQIYTVDETLAG